MSPPPPPFASVERACARLRRNATRYVSEGRTKELVWNQSRTVGLTSGGGTSRVFDLPPFQTNCRVPARAGSHGGLGRGIPDVAANASSLTGFKIWADDTVMSMGGTSAAAPLWAALVACLNESLGRRIGYLTPLLYARGVAQHGALRDIVAGNNQMAGRQGYRARRGWDACTGLGTPHGKNLLRCLQRGVGRKSRSPIPSSHDSRALSSVSSAAAARSSSRRRGAGRRSGS